MKIIPTPDDTYDSILPTATYNSPLASASTTSDQSIASVLVTDAFSREAAVRRPPKTGGRKRLSSHRLLTSNAIVTAKRLELEKKEREAEEKEERKRKREKKAAEEMVWEGKRSESSRESQGGASKKKRVTVEATKCMVCKKTRTFSTRINSGSGRMGAV